MLSLIAIYYKQKNKLHPVRADFYPLGKVTKIGHRGSPMLARENTLKSFSQAFQAGLKGIELDVQLSKDGKLIIFHDWKMKNNNGIFKKINSMDYSEISTIAKETNFHIPLLNEVLDILPENRFINIEIKSFNLFSSKIEEKIVERILSYNILKNVVISSFNPFSLRRIKKINPKIISAYLWTNGSPPFLFNTPLWIWICHPDGFYIDISHADKKIIHWAQRKKMTIITYTVNNSRDYYWATEMKLDGIITDNPYLMINNISK